MSSPSTLQQEDVSVLPDNMHENATLVLCEVSLLSRGGRSSTYADQVDTSVVCQLLKRAVVLVDGDFAQIVDLVELTQARNSRACLGICDARRPPAIPHELLSVLDSSTAPAMAEIDRDLMNAVVVDDGEVLVGACG